MVDDRDPVAQLLGFLQIVRRQHHGDAAVVEALDIVPKLLAQFDVDPRSRFVEHDDRRRMYYGFRDEQAAFHAPRQLARIGVAFVRQMIGPDQIVRNPLVIWPSVETRLSFVRFIGGEEWIEVDFLVYAAVSIFGVAW